MYEDDILSIYMGFDWIGRLQMHAQYYVPVTKSVLRYTKEVLADLDEDIRAKGVTEYYTLVNSPEAFRYCEFMGFKTTKETINDEYEYMKRVIA